MSEPTGEGIPVQYRFVADESTADQYARAALRLRGARLAVLVVLGVVLWALLSVLAIAALADALPGPELLLGASIIGLVSTGAFFLFLHFVGLRLNRWFFGRHWPPGTVLETGFSQDGMLVSRNGNPRLVSYADVRRIGRTQAMATLVVRPGSVEYYPRGLFPDDAVATVKAGRAAGRTLPAKPVELVGEVEAFVVPAGWDRTVARVFTRTMITSPGIYVRLPIVLVLCLLLVLMGVGWWILLVPPAVLVLVLVRGYLGTRSRSAAAQPEGAVLSVTAGKESFAFHRPSRTDIVAYADVRKVLVRGEVAVLQIDGFGPRWVLPAALLPAQLTR